MQPVLITLFNYFTDKGETKFGKKKNQKYLGCQLFFKSQSYVKIHIDLNIYFHTEFLKNWSGKFKYSSEYYLNFSISFCSSVALELSGSVTLTGKRTHLCRNWLQVQKGSNCNEF